MKTMHLNLCPNCSNPVEIEVTSFMNKKQSYCTRCAVIQLAESHNDLRMAYEYHIKRECPGTKED